MLTMTVAYVIQPLRCHQTSDASRLRIERRDEIDQSPPTPEKARHPGNIAARSAGTCAQGHSAKGSFGEIARLAPGIEIAALSRPQSGVGSPGPVYTGSGWRVMLDT